MIGKTISHYRILEKPPTSRGQHEASSGQVGEGEMGVVYKVRKFPATVPTCRDERWNFQNPDALC